MTFTERYYRSPRTHLGMLLDRLRREQRADPQHASSFQEVCDMVSIPRDLRRALLGALLGAGYATDAGGGKVRLTALGGEAATAEPGDEGDTPEDRRLYRSVPTPTVPPRQSDARPGGMRQR